MGGLRSWTMLEMSFKVEKIGPVGKNPSLVSSCIFFKNYSNLIMHISLNFNLMRVLLDFLEILGCPLNKAFGLISIESSMFV